jgi:hypothetical protein
MPGLLRLDAFNQLERLEDQADQFGIQFKGDIILDKPRATSGVLIWMCDATARQIVIELGVELSMQSHL